jgi:hypothetical protein
MARQKIPVELRFWDKVEKGASCWLWVGSGDRYGHIQVNGRPVGAHRVGYELQVGPIPPGKFVLHQCDNPRCIRGEHLFIGDAQSNMDDKVSKRRWRGNTKLSPEKVEALKADRGLGLTYDSLAQKYNISTGHAHNLVKGVRNLWKQKSE